MIKSTYQSRRSAGTAILCGSAQGLAAVAAHLEAWPLDIIGAVSPDSRDFLPYLQVLGSRLTAQAVAAADAPVAAAVLCDKLVSPLAVSEFLRAASDLGLRPMIVDAEREDLAPRPLALPDLLARPQAVADPSRIRDAIAGKRVMVTGAGGSIGSELCRQLGALRPAHMTLLDNSEFNLYSIDREFAVRAPDQSRARALCDIRDGDAVQRVFRREEPDVVFHTGALKHVPMVEEFVAEGVLTNVLGTRNIAEAVSAHGAHMLFVSTDKAADPVSMMGATKRAGEIFCQCLDREAVAKGQSRFITARLGNVLGSTGSVTPLFERQIAAGGPVTVTAREASRFFITIPQAAAFLIETFADGVEPGAPRGVAHVLDMGAHVRVADLACAMIRLAGKEPGRDVKIEYVGMRPGEKLTEQLIAEGEEVESGPGARIMAVRSAPYDLAVVRASIDRLAALARAGHDGVVRQTLRALVGADVLGASAGL